MSMFLEFMKTSIQISPQCLPKKKCKEVCTTNTLSASMSNDLGSIIDIHSVTKAESLFLYIRMQICEVVKISK